MRTGSESEDYGQTNGIGVRNLLLTPTGGTVMTTDRQYLVVKVDDMVASAAIVVGGSGATGEVANSASTIYDFSGAYRSLVTSNVSGNVAGWNKGGANGPAHDPLTEFTAHLKTGPNAADVQNARIWIALADGDITASSNPTANNVIGFRYATDVDGTAFWRIYNATGSTSVAVSTPVAVVNGQDYFFRVQQPTPNSFALSINGIFTTFGVTTNVANGTKLGWTMTLTTLTTAAKTVNCGFFEISRR